MQTNNQEEKSITIVIYSYPGFNPRLYHDIACAAIVKETKSIVFVEDSSAYHKKINKDSVLKVIPNSSAYMLHLIKEAIKHEKGALEVNLSRAVNQFYSNIKNIEKHKLILMHLGATQEDLEHVESQKKEKARIKLKEIEREINK